MNSQSKNFIISLFIIIGINGLIVLIFDPFGWQVVPEEMPAKEIVLLPTTLKIYSGEILINGTPAENGQALFEGDSIEVVENGAASINFFDGSVTQLNAGSRLTLTVLNPEKQKIVRSISMNAEVCAPEVYVASHDNPRPDYASVGWEPPATKDKTDDKETAPETETQTEEASSPPVLKTEEEKFPCDQDSDCLENEICLRNFCESASSFELLDEWDEDLQAGLDTILAENSDIQGPRSKTASANINTTQNTNPEEDFETALQDMENLSKDLENVMAQTQISEMFEYEDSVPLTEPVQETAGKLYIEKSQSLTQKNHVTPGQKNLTLHALRFHTDNNAAKVVALQFRRVGSGRNTDFDMLWLEMNDRRISPKVKVTDDIVRIPLENPLMVYANIKTIKLKGDMSLNAGESSSRFVLFLPEWIDANTKSKIGFFPLGGADVIIEEKDLS